MMCPYKNLQTIVLFFMIYQTMKTSIDRFNFCMEELSNFLDRYATDLDEFDDED